MWRDIYIYFLSISKTYTFTRYGKTIAVLLITKYCLKLKQKLLQLKYEF